MLFGNIMISGKMKRYLQIVTGIHRIHSVKYSWGWKIPFTPYAWFDKHGLKKLGKISFNYQLQNDYHNCTITNQY